MNRFVFSHKLYDLIARSYARDFPVIRYDVLKAYAEANFAQDAARIYADMDEHKRKLGEIAQVLSRKPESKLK